LKDIGIQLGTYANEIDRKLKNVYSPYTRERQAHKAMNKSGAGRDFCPKRFEDELISFLQDMIDPENWQEAGLTEGIQVKIMFCNGL